MTAERPLCLDWCSVESSWTTPRRGKIGRAPNMACRVARGRHAWGEFVGALLRQRFC